MKPLFLAVLAASILTLVTTGGAYGFGRLSLYADAAFTECTLSDTAPGTVKIYMAETSFGATGLRFRVAASSGFTGVWLGETSPFTTIGNSQTDLSIGFGQCMDNRFLVLTMTYELFGTSTCSELSIVGVPAIGEPICTGCVFSEEPCWGYDPIHVNCEGAFNCNPVAVEPTTWGQIKALYRN